MTKTKTTNRALDQLLLSQGDLITRRQVLDSGMSEGELRHRLRPGGPWMVVLPGIYLPATAYLQWASERSRRSCMAGAAA